MNGSTRVTRVAGGRFGRGTVHTFLSFDGLGQTQHKARGLSYAQNNINIYKNHWANGDSLVNYIGVS